MLQSDLTAALRSVQVEVAEWLQSGACSAGTGLSLAPWQPGLRADRGPSGAGPHPELATTVMEYYINLPLRRHGADQYLHRLDGMMHARMGLRGAVVVGMPSEGLGNLATLFSPKCREPSALAPGTWHRVAVHACLVGAIMYRLLSPNTLLPSVRSHQGLDLTITDQRPLSQTAPTNVCLGSLPRSRPVLPPHAGARLLYTPIRCNCRLHSSSPSVRRTAPPCHFD